MARNSSRARRQLQSVSVDDCRIRLQTGEPVTFVDARRAEDWAAATTKVAAALRSAPGDAPAYLPCPKRNYIVVYCA